MRASATACSLVLAVACAALGCGRTGPSEAAARPSPANAPTAAPRPKGPRPLRDVRLERTSARRERGRYLAQGILQCFVCHSDRDWSKPGAPPVASRGGAGHVWEDRPWLVAPNLTPDDETGIGPWTDDMLARAIREGISHDGRVLHPQMYYGSFRSLSDEDVASVVVYLRSLKPVRNPLPQTAVPEDRKATLVAPEPLLREVQWGDPSDPVERGRYLVRVADCLGCHTSWYSETNPGLFGGGNLIEGGSDGVFSTNLTPDPSGIPYYDDDLFIEVMRTGRVKARILSPLMPWIAFRNLSDDDLRAIFAFLRSLPSVSHNISNVDPPATCAACGQTHGSGDRNKPKELGTLALDPKDLDAYVGRYSFNDGFTLVLRREGNGLLLAIGDEEKAFPLGRRPDGTFVAKELGDLIRFERDSSGRVGGLSDAGDRAVRVE